MSDLVFVDFRFRIVHRAVDGQLNSLGNQKWCDDAMHESRNVGGVFDDFILASEVQQSADDVLTTVCLFGDHANIVEALIVAWEVVHQQVSVHEDDAERVVDFMGDAGGQLPHAGEFLGLHQGLLSGGQLLVGILQFTISLAEPVDGIGEAHFVFGQSPVDRGSMFTAGFVAARAAVEFIFRVGLAELGEDLLQRFGWRFRDPLITGREVALQRQALAGCQLLLQFAGRQGGHAAGDVFGHSTTAKE